MLMGEDLEGALLWSGLTMFCDESPVVGCERTTNGTRLFLGTGPAGWTQRMHVPVSEPPFHGASTAAEASR